MDKHRLALGVALGMLISVLLAGGLILAAKPTLAQGPTTPPTASAGATAQGATALSKIRAALRQALAKHAAKGQITAINGTTLTISAASGNLTVTTDNSTKFRRDGQAITLSDLKVGDNIAVVGKKTNNPIAAKGILVIVPHEAGVVTGISGSNITIQRDYLNGTIVTTGATVFSRGKDTITLADIKAGDHIRATGTANADGTFAATRVFVQVPTTGGKVTAINGSTITIQRGTLSGTIVTTSTTTITRGGQTIKLSDITVGSTIVAQGKPNDDGTFTATNIVVKGK